ncbi:MAG: DinB family protein [Terracidiphilus sp.]|nr:DinB family protein [Terracidiphilus sp.]
MDFHLDQAATLLARTPATLDAQLRALPAAWTEAREGDGTMSPREVVAHLIDADLTNWMPRVETILRSGETEPFPSFDRFAKIRASADAPLTALLDEFTHVRAQRLTELHALALTPSQLALRGAHPALGIVTVSEVLAAWTAHDLTHLHQIARLLAHQYRDAVGPFARFLGVLHCTAHGA